MARLGQVPLKPHAVFATGPGVVGHATVVVEVVDVVDVVDVDVEAGVTVVLDVDDVVVVVVLVVAPALHTVNVQFSPRNPVLLYTSLHSMFQMYSPFGTL